MNTTRLTLRSLPGMLHARRGILLPAGIAALYFLLTYLLIHTPPIRGIADQGDFERMFVWIGASYRSHDPAVKYFGWVHRYYDLGAPATGNTLSSEFLFLYPARMINTLLHPGVFDIRVLGLLHTAAFAVILTVFLGYLRKLKRAFFWIAVPVVLFVLPDIGYISYFNSGYQEASGFVYLLLYVTVLLKCLTDRSAGRTIRNWLLLTVASVLLITAKAQYFSVFFPAIVTNALVFRHRISPKLIAASSIGLLLFTLLFFYAGAPRIIRKWNIYNTVFPQILGNTNDPSRAARILGLDPVYLKYAGISAYDPGNGIDDAGLDGFLASSRFLSVFTYYAMTPGEFFSLTGTIARRSFTNTADYLGYYEYGSGMPAVAQPSSYNAWGTFKRTYLSKAAAGLPLFLIVTPVILTALYIRKRASILPVGVFLSLAACSQFFTIVFSEGLYGGSEKHLYLYDLTFDGIVCFLAAAAILHAASGISAVWKRTPSRN